MGAHKPSIALAFMRSVSRVGVHERLVLLLTLRVLHNARTLCVPLLLITDRRSSDLNKYTTYVSERRENFCTKHNTLLWAGCQPLIIRSMR